MEHEQGHLIEYRTLLKVWAALVVLTGLLVAVSRISAAHAAWAMLTISPLKAALVIYFFMHLKYEGLLLKTMVFTALFTFLTFIGLMFVDISFR